MRVLRRVATGATLTLLAQASDVVYMRCVAERLCRRSDMVTGSSCLEDPEYTRVADDALLVMMSSWRRTRRRSSTAAHRTTFTQSLPARGVPASTLASVELCAQRS